MSFLSQRDGLVWIYRHMNICGNAHPYEIMWTSCCILTRVLIFWHIPIHDKGLQQLLLYLCQKKVALLAQRSSGPELGGFAGKENRSAFQVGMPRPKHFQRRVWSWCNFPFFKIHHVTPLTMTKSRKSKTWPVPSRGPRWRVLRTLATLMTIQIQTKSLLLSMRWGAWSRFGKKGDQFGCRERRWFPNKKGKCWLFLKIFDGNMMTNDDILVCPIFGQTPWCRFIASIRPGYQVAGSLHQLVIWIGNCIGSNFALKGWASCCICELFNRAGKLLVATKLSQDSESWSSISWEWK